MKHIYQVMFFLAVLAPCFGGSVKDYTLDLQGPRKLLSQPRSARTPDRVSIYVSGEHPSYEKISTFSVIEKEAACTLTNASSIDELIAVVRRNDNSERITNLSQLKGITYHIVFFDDAKKTLVHLRVFEPTEYKGKWRPVHPVSDTRSFFFNDQIGTWLDVHLRASKPKSE